jgi:sugar lactone lactonase YvrE
MRFVTLAQNMKLLSLILLVGRLFAQTPAKIPFDSDLDFLKLPADMNFGEVLGITMNSKGQIVVLNHPGTATSGPLYGNATTQLFVFDANGKFLREMGKGVYGLGYSHSVRFDKYDNLWVVDKGTMSIMRFNPAGRVTMNLGRREEGPDEHHFPAARGAPPVHIDGYFNGPTDVAWDSKDNIYISDGYHNSRVAKLDKHGDWIKSWGSRGRENGQFSLPHNIAVDRQDNVYVADRNNRRIQVFDSNGTWQRNITMTVPYDKKRHPTLGNTPQNLPDETQPWTLCITNTPTQYLFTSDENPGRVYKVALDGRIVGYFGESGHEIGQFNWIHGIACPSENSLLIADMNNWRVQKITLHPEKVAATR